MKSISSYFGNGQKSSATTFSSLSAASRTGHRRQLLVAGVDRQVGAPRGPPGRRWPLQPRQRGDHLDELATSPSGGDPARRSGRCRAPPAAASSGRSWRLSASMLARIDTARARPRSGLQLARIQHAVLLEGRHCVRAPPRAARRAWCRFVPAPASRATPRSSWRSRRPCSDRTLRQSPSRPLASRLAASFSSSFPASSSIASAAIVFRTVFGKASIADPVRGTRICCR
jgi:hypothetical protein